MTSKQANVLEPSGELDPARLRRELLARDKTIVVLVEQVERAQVGRGSSLMAFEDAINLERRVKRKTAELEEALKELRRTQSELLQRHKLTAIGELAAGIAHEINSPTQYVCDNLAFLDKSFRMLSDVVTVARERVNAARSADASEEDALHASLQELFENQRLSYVLREIPDALEQSLDGMGRVARLVSAMKAFSHPSDGVKEPCQLSEIIETSVTVSRHEWKYVSDLVTDYDPGVPAVYCLRDELGQVMLNLIVNASHAIDGRIKRGDYAQGLIRISTRLVSKESNVPDAVEIRVVDNGTGIPDAVKSRVFEPFFTTKPVGRGTGQGLTIAYAAVVEKHGGHLHFEDTPGGGTTFVIVIPVDSERAEGPGHGA